MMCEWHSSTKGSDLQVMFFDKIDKCWANDDIYVMFSKQGVDLESKGSKGEKDKD